MNLRCPSCHAEFLERGTSAFRCRTCNIEYAMDPQTGAGSLLAEDGDSAIKRDVKAWWGDLYRQAYAGHEDGLDADGIERLLTELESLFRTREHLAAVEMPLKNLAGCEVLEIGPGSGAHSALFKARGASVTAIDITPERALATARKLALVRGDDGQAHQADAENLPFASNSFDIVYSNGVLHHSEDTDRCIAEVFRVLKPGGRAILMLYSRHSATYWFNVVPRAVITGEIFRWPEAQWIGRLTEGTPKFGSVKNPITRVYSARQLRELLSAFDVVSLRKSSFQFDNICIPKMTQIRNFVLNAIGRMPHPGGLLVYGRPIQTETFFELALGPALGFAWNIVARKPDNSRR